MSKEGEIVRFNSQKLNLPGIMNLQVEFAKRIARAPKRDRHSEGFGWVLLGREMAGKFDGASTRSSTQLEPPPGRVIRVDSCQDSFPNLSDVSNSCFSILSLT
jgi:hypothetical protein